MASRAGGGFEVGSIFARVGARFDDRGFDQFDKRHDRAEKRARRGVTTHAKADVNEASFRRAGDRDDRLRRKARRPSVTHVKADTNERSFRQAEDRMTRAERHAQRSTTRLGLHAGRGAGFISTQFKEAGRSALGAGVSIAAAYTTFTGAKEAVDEVVELAKATSALKNVTGEDAETNSAWIQVAGQRGVELNKLRMAFVNLSKHQKGAREGTEKDVELFKQLGISMDEVRRMTPGELMDRFADSIKGIEDPGKRAALVQQTLSRGGVQLLGTLKDGSKGLDDLRDKAKRYGATLDEDGVKKTMEYVKTQREMNLATMGIKHTVGEALIPVLKDGADKFNRFVLQVREGRGQGGRFRETAERLWKSFREGVAPVVKAGKEIVKFGAAHPELTRLAVTVGAVGVALNKIRTSNAVRGIGLVAKGLRGLAQTKAGEAVADNVVQGLGTMRANAGRRLSSFRDYLKRTLGRAGASAGTSAAGEAAGNIASDTVSGTRRREGRLRSGLRNIFRRVGIGAGETAASQAAGNIAADTVSGTGRRSGRLRDGLKRIFRRVGIGAGESAAAEAAGNIASDTVSGTSRRSGRIRDGLKRIFRRVGLGAGESAASTAAGAIAGDGAAAGVSGSLSGGRLGRLRGGLNGKFKGLGKAAGGALVLGVAVGMVGLGNMVAEKLHGVMKNVIDPWTHKHFGKAGDVYTAIRNGIMKGAEALPGAGEIIKKVNGGAEGGIVTKRGIVRGYAMGGVAGLDPRDTVPAMLRPGEGILTPEATNAIGGARGVAALNRSGGRAVGRKGAPMDIAKPMDDERKKLEPVVKKIRDTLGLVPKDGKKHADRTARDVRGELEGGRKAWVKSVTKSRDDVLDRFEDVRKGSGRSVRRLADSVTDRLTGMRKDSTREARRLANAVGDRMDDARASSVRSSRRMRVAVGDQYEAMGGDVRRRMRAVAARTSDGMGAARDGARRGARGVRNTVAASYGSMDTAVWRGVGYVSDATNKALKGFGAKPVKLDVAKPKPLARGGFTVGRPGDHGADSIPMMAPPDWGVLTRHQLAALGLGFAQGGSVPIVVGSGEYLASPEELDVFDQMARPKFGGLGGLWSKVTRPHYLAKGGMVRVPGDADTTGGRDLVNPAIAGKVGAWAKKYHAAINYAYDPGHHQSAGHNVTGTATDVGPGPGGSWDMLEAGLRVLVAAGYKVLYGTNGVGTPYPNHGRGNHAHIEWGSGGALPSMATNVRAPKVKGTGPLAEIASKALGMVTKGANAKLDAVGGAMGDTLALGPGGVGKKIFDYFVGRGFSKPQAAAFVGNFQQESGLNPGAVQRGGPGRGLGQWGGGRFKNLVAFARGRGKPWQDLQTQLDFVWHELTGSERGAYGAIKGAGSLAAAVNAVGGKYERFGVRGNRLGPAQAALKAYAARGGLVRRLARGGRVGGPVAHVARPGVDPNPNGPPRGLLKAANRIGGDFGKAMTKADDLGNDYSYFERKFGLSEEDLVDETTGTINQPALKQREKELRKLLAVRKQIVAQYQRARAFARKAIGNYGMMIARARRAINRTKGKKGAGRRRTYAAWIKGWQGKQGEWRGRLKEIGGSLRDAQLDVMEASNELGALVPGARADASEAKDALTQADTEGEATSGEAAAPSPLQVAEAAVAQLQAFQAGRSELFGQFGNNFSSRGQDPFSTPLGQAAGARYFGAGTATGGEPATGGRELTQNVYVTLQRPDEVHNLTNALRHESEAAFG